MSAAEWRFEAIGTQWAISTAEPLGAADRDAVLACVGGYDRVWSRFRPDSTVSALARDGGEAELPEHAPELFELYRRLDRLTAGAVSPLVGASLVRLGYDADYSLRPSGAALPAPAVDELVRLDGRRLTLAAPALLDVGAAGKGQLVDLVSELLLRRGAEQLTVDAGGDLRHLGDEPLRVALEHPYRPDLAIGVVSLSAPRGAIAGSAVNRRAWGDGLHHVLDARTGMPVDEVAATWAVAATAMVADAAATALFFASGPEVERELDVDWVRVFTDGRMQCSSRLREGIFTS